MKKRKYWITPASYLVAITLSTLLTAAALSRRAVKPIVFTGKCEAVKVPAKLQCGLTEVDSINARGFDAKVDNIQKSVIKSIVGEHVFGVDKLALTQNPLRGTEQTSIHVRSAGRSGPLIATLPSGSRLSGDLVNPEFGPIITADIPNGGMSTVTWEAQRLDFYEVIRMRPDLTSPPKAIENAEAFSIIFSSREPALAAATFSTQSNQSDAPCMSFRYPKSLNAARFYPANPTEALRLESGKLTIESAFDPTIKIAQYDPHRQPKGIPVDVTISSNDILLKRISVVPSPSESVAAVPRWCLHLDLEAMASSVLLGDEEVLPTRLESILNGPVWQKGLLGLILSFVTIVIGTFLKRSLDTLSEYLIPDPPEPNQTAAEQPTEPEP